MNHKYEIHDIYKNFTKLVDTHFSNPVKIFHSNIAMKYKEIDLLISSMLIGPCLITLVLIHPSKMVEPSLSIGKALIMFMLCSSGANRP